MKHQSNVLTVDLEEWFVVESLAGRFSYEDWPGLPTTLERNCDRLLALFRRRDVLATWFVVGWCAERHPELMRRIADHGHEIGCHSYRHRRVDHIDEDTFRKDTERALEAIVNTTGCRPLGYRAPSWSINESVSWAFEVLGEFAFEYDSSIFPIKHDIYGMPEGPRQLFKMRLKNGRYLYEIPASTHRILGHNLPLGGGGYLRHSPYWYSRRMIRKLNEKGQAAIVYVHPWEIDPEPPPVSDLTMLQRFRTYGSTDTLELKLDRLLSEFHFSTMIDHVRYSTRNRIGFER